MRKVFLALLWVASALIAGVAFTFFEIEPSNHVIAQWTQTSGVNYDSFDPYTLSVIETGTDYLALSWSKTHTLFIGRGTDAPSYGHRLRFSFHPSDGTSMAAFVDRLSDGLPWE